MSDVTLSTFDRESFARHLQENGHVLTEVFARALNQSLGTRRAVREMVREETADLLAELRARIERLEAK